MKSLILFPIIAFILISCSSQFIAHPETDRSPSNFKSCLEAMNELIAYKPYQGVASKFFSKAISLNELESFYGGESLIEIQRRTSNEEILSNNENMKKLFSAPLVVTKIEGKYSEVTSVDANTIYKSMAESEVNKNHYCYDKEGTIGFCFGRATIAHMEAIVRNVHPDAIKKIWIAGDMGIWGHHVATMVYTKEGWVVLDTNLGKIIDANKWVAHYMPMKQKDAKEIMVFTTQAGRFGPYDNRPYNAIDLFNTNSSDFDKAKDYFNGYFHDYFQSLDNVKNPPMIEEFKKPVKARWWTRFSSLLGLQAP